MYSQAVRGQVWFVQFFQLFDTQFWQLVSIEASFKTVAGITSMVYLQRSHRFDRVTLSMFSLLVAVFPCAVDC